MRRGRPACRSKAWLFKGRFDSCATRGRRAAYFSESRKEPRAASPTPHRAIAVVVSLSARPTATAKQLGGFRMIRAMRSTRIIRKTCAVAALLLAASAAVVAIGWVILAVLRWLWTCTKLLLAIAAIREVFKVKRRLQLRGELCASPPPPLPAEDAQQLTNRAAPPTPAPEDAQASQQAPADVAEGLQAALKRLQQEKQQLQQQLQQQVDVQLQLQAAKALRDTAALLATTAEVQGQLASARASITSLATCSQHHAMNAQEPTRELEPHASRCVQQLDCGRLDCCPRAARGVGQVLLIATDPCLAPTL
jgi:hypothetical protein